jgi:predicted TIM-barrel fold metal-dependent hydrolase
MLSTRPFGRVVKRRASAGMTLPMHGVEVLAAGEGEHSAHRFEPRPRVDHHQHLFSPKVALLLRSQSQNAPPRISAADLIGMLDAAGIERALVLSVAYLYGNPRVRIEDEYLGVRSENDWTLGEGSRYPERLRTFCSFNPLKEYAYEELSRCAGTHHGLKLHLANSDVQLDVPDHVDRLQRVFAEANRNGMPVVVHLRANIRNRRPYGASQARTFVEQVLPAAPDVPVQVAHMAGTGPGYDDPPADRALAVFVQRIADGDQQVAGLWFDVAGLANDGMSPSEGRRMAERIRQIGVDRVLFGSDAAAGGNLPPREAWAAFMRLPLTTAEFAAVARSTAPYAA